MWVPNYTIRPRLLRIIRKIGEALGSIRAGQLNEPKRQWLTLEARALSSYASTSIEGNPLPLTDVKRLLKNAPGQIVAPCGWRRMNTLFSIIWHSMARSLNENTARFPGAHWPRVRKILPGLLNGA